MVVADHRSRAYGVPQKHRLEDQAHVHQNAVGGDAVLSGVRHQPHVEQHTHQGHGDIAHQLGGAVGTGPPQRFAVKGAAHQPQAAGILPSEVNKGHRAAHQLTQSRGRRRALQPEAEDAYKHGVQHHVGEPRSHRHAEAQLRLLSGGKEALELKLQNIEGQSRQVDGAVDHAAAQQLPLRSHQRRRPGQKQDAQNSQRRATGRRGVDQQREDLVGLLRLSLPHGLGDQGAAAGAEHEADAAQNHQIGHDEVDGGKGGLAHEVGHKEAVHHAVN